MKLFGRQWRVTVDDFASSDVDIRFKATRTLTTNPGTAEVEIYNLSLDRRRRLHLAHQPFVRLEAGYDEAMPIIFQGDGRRIDIQRDGADWITKVTAGDGEHALRTARLGRSFAPDTAISTVVQHAAQTMGLGVGNVLDQLRGRGLDRLGDVFPGGVVLHGLAEVNLRMLLDSTGLSWSVQDGVLQAIPRGGALSRSAVVLSADHGLVDSPEVGKNGVVTAKALLIPDLVPGQLVQLESQIVSGLYRIEKAEYSGETRGNDWYVQMDMRART